MSPVSTGGVRIKNRNEAVLALLEEARGRYFSGEEMALRLSVSRAAVWKAVRALRDEGYAIAAAPNRGYALAETADILSASGIRKHLAGDAAALRVETQERVSSTNTVLKERAAAGEPAGAVLVAGEQTTGRGRMGRGFFSPGGTGLYLSMLLRPHEAPGEAALITAAAAVAVAETVEAVSGKETGIKWVNDVYLGGKKICGILTEAGVNLESGALDYAVLGIGVNVYAPAGGFPDGLADTAAAIFEAPRFDLRSRLAAEILNRVTPLCADLSARRFVPAYRRRSLVLGREIQILSGGETGRALALSVDDDCRLRVRYPDGREALLSAGEVSIRLN